MIVVLGRGTTEAQTAEVVSALEAAGLGTRVLTSLDRPVVHVTHGPARAARKVRGMDCVQGLVPTSGPRIRREGRRFYPYHFINWSSASLLVLGILVFLSGFFPPALGADIDPTGGPTELGTPWYLRAPVAFLALFPEGLEWLGSLALGVLVVVAFLLPRIDRWLGRGAASRGPVLVVGLAVLAGWVYLSLGGLF